jgi:hypothetical protein
MAESETISPALVLGEVAKVAAALAKVSARLKSLEAAVATLDLIQQEARKAYAGQQVTLDAVQRWISEVDPPKRTAGPKAGLN